MEPTLAVTSGLPPTPSTLTDEQRRVLRDMPAGLVVQWAALDPGELALSVLTERERRHARGLVEIRGVEAAAAYLHQQFEIGDHVQERDRLELAVGARVKIDELHHRVESQAPNGRVILRGPNGGRVELMRPNPPREVWSAWHGQDRADARLRHYTRTDAGHFVSAPK